MPVDLPERLLRLGRQGPDAAGWLDRLPRLVVDVLAEWDLTLDGASAAGQTALVLPVRTSGGRAAAVKFGWPHPEAEHEHLALRAWAGAGAVQLWRADPVRSVLLLERAHSDTDLTSVPIYRACEVVAALYSRLHRPAIPQLNRLSQLTADWKDRLGKISRHPLVPRRLVSQAISLAADFAVASTTDGTLIHSDLHYYNVLAADREPWLAIDPKPLSGDPTYEVAPLLWNRWDEVLAADNARAAILSRFYTVLDCAGLDEARARAWVVVRGMVNVLWALEDQARGATLEPEWITMSTTMVKAMSP